jgi:hypothetical protein
MSVARHDDIFDSMPFASASRGNGVSFPESQFQEGPMTINPATVRTGNRMQVGFSDQSELMNFNGPAFASIEADGTYEHLAIGTPAEGYALFYRSAAGDNTAFDVFADTLGITPISHQVVRNDARELVKLSETTTTDGRIRIRHSFTWSTNSTRVVIEMLLTNTSGEDLTDLLVKRYADLDVDTGGTRGWAGFRNHFDTNRDSVMAFNDPSEAPQGHRSHIVNMVAMWGDIPLLDTFAGLFGFNQYRQRANTNPVPSPVPRVDGIGILEWHADRFRSGETFRLRLYYDAFCICSDIRAREGSEAAAAAGATPDAGGGERVTQPEQQIEWSPEKSEATEPGG